MQSGRCNNRRRAVHCRWRLCGELRVFVLTTQQACCSPLCCACASPSCQSGVEVLLKQFNGIPSWVAIAVRCVLTGSPQSILANAENIANGVLNSLVKDPAARKQMTAAARLIIGIVKALDSSGVSGLRQQR